MNNEYRIIVWAGLLGAVTLVAMQLLPSLGVGFSSQQASKCQQRPACLDYPPRQRCAIPEPATGWCLTATPTSESDKN